MYRMLFYEWTERGSNGVHLLSDGRALISSVSVTVLFDLCNNKHIK